MICKRTMKECQTQSMCYPHGGCSYPGPEKIEEMERRIARLERLMEHVCPDKSNDI